MKLALTALFAALLLAAVAGQNSGLRATEADSSAITACAVQGPGCTQPPLDSSLGTAAAQHLVFSQGCASSDLHVVRYAPADGVSGEVVVAKWCA